MAAFAFIRAKIVARFFCAAEVKTDAPVAKITLAACGPAGSGNREACCNGLRVFLPVALPETFPLGGAAFANDGAAGGREEVISFGGGLPVITLDLGFAGGTGALVLFTIFLDSLAEGVRLRVGLRAMRTVDFLDGFRFARARRLRSSLGGTSFTVGSSLLRRGASEWGCGANSLLIGIRLGGAKIRSPKLGRKTLEAVSTIGPVPLSPTTLRSTNTSFELFHGFS